MFRPNSTMSISQLIHKRFQRVASALVFLVIAGVVIWKLASIQAASAAGTTPTGILFAPTVPNKSLPPGKTPLGMTWIPGGEFSMGAQDPPDMQHDMVGMKATADSRPVHRVYVDGFWMDKTDVTNAEFARFVAATHYITVAERKPKAEDFPELHPKSWYRAPSSSRRLPAPSRLTTNCSGGATSKAPTGGILRARRATSRAKKIIRWFPSPMRTHSPMQSGLANVFQLKRSGSSPHAVVLLASPSSGETRSNPAASSWLTLFRVTSQTKIQTRMDSSLPHPSPRSRPTATASTIWLGTSGSGSRTGIGRIITNNSPLRALSAVTQPVRATRWIPRSPAYRSGSCGEDPFCAPISTVRATW